MAIIITRKGVPATVVEKSEFEKEDRLQEYIYDHPETIPVYDIHPDKRLLIVAREFATRSLSIDALAVDRDGDIYIVETKLYKNTDRRRVVAQVLEYGASLWKEFADFERFKSILDERVRKKWNVGFRDKVRDSFGLNDEAADSMLENMRQNLKDGNLKFVVLMNSMDEGLKDLITYVNQKSKFDIYGVELEFYKHSDYEIAIPKIFGAEVRKDIPPLLPPMTEDRLIQLIRDKHSQEIAKLAEELIAKLKSLELSSRGDRTCMTYGVGADGEFFPLVSLYATNIWFNFTKKVTDSIGPDHVKEFKQKLNNIGKFYKPEDVSDPTNKGALGPHYDILKDKLDSFVKAVSEIKELVKSSVAAAQ